MTAAVGARPGAPMVSFPARCAVAVICGDQLISQVYPAALPIEVFLDDAVELLDAELRRRGRPGLAPGSGYELQRVNGIRLDTGKSLDELGVEDGTALQLVTATDGDCAEPQYESLSTGLARVGRTLFPPVTAQTVAHCALAILAMAAAVLAVAGVRARLTGDSPVPAVAVGTAGLLAAAAAAGVWRWWPRRTDLLIGFGWLAVPLLALGAGTAPPGGLGAPHLFIVALAAAVLAVALTALTGAHRDIAAAVVTLCVLGGALAAARMWRPIPAQWLAMCTLIALLVLLTLAPTIALRAARIRPPHFGSVTGRDLFHRADGMPVDAVVPVDQTAAAEPEADPNPDTTPRGAAVAAAARSANAVLTGICVAAAITLVPAVWATLLPGRPRAGAAAVLAGLVVMIFVLRSRNFTDRRQAVPLICGAAAAVCAGVARYVWAAPAGSTGALVGGALVLTGFGAGTLIAALLVPPTRFTPLVRMTAEWLELLAIVVALPLAAWIGGLFAWVRMR